MRLPFSQKDVDAVKKELGGLLPEVKSSHRVEALARGLGWNTNAALRADLPQGQMERQVDDAAFNNYLAQHGISETRHDALSEAVLRHKFADQHVAIRAVMAREANLTYFGFGVYDRMQSPEQREVQFRENSERMLSACAIQEFMRACEFLSQFEMRETINDALSSYGLKHRAERFHRERHGESCYVSNGMLIAAAVHLGFKIQSTGPNAYLNISLNRRPRFAGGNRQTGRLAGYVGGKNRLRAWRNMMVGAVNAGLDQCVFGLEPDDNRWAGDEAFVYRFSFLDMPAIASVSDAGYDELSIHVAVNPAERAEKFIKSANAGLYAGDAFASGWLERRDGKWLQNSDHPCNAFRREILPIIANAVVMPTGYSEKGPFVL